MRALLLAVFVLFAWPGAARAMLLEPSAIDLAVDPGGVSATSAVVVNNSKSPSTIALRLVDASLDSEGAWQFTGDAATWMSLDVRELALPAEEIHDITLTASPPTTVEDGLYTFGLLAHDVAREDSSGFSLGTGFVSLVFVTVGDASELHATCESFTATVDGRLLTTEAVIQNTGSGILQAHGTITAQSAFGSDHDIASWNETLRRVLPGQTRKLTETHGFPWYLTGPVTIALAADGIDCASASLVVPPSASLLAVLMGGVGLGVVSVWVWRVRS